jgi:hypothetical protein
VEKGEGKGGWVGKKGVWVAVLQDDAGVNCCKPFSYSWSEMK